MSRPAFRAASSAPAVTRGLWGAKAGKLGARAAGVSTNCSAVALCVSPAVTPTPKLPCAAVAIVPVTLVAVSSV